VACPSHSSKTPGSLQLEPAAKCRCLFEAPFGKLTLGASCIRWLSIYGLVKGPNLIQARYLLKPCKVSAFC